MLKTLREDEEELARLRAEIEREEAIQRQRQEAAFRRGREALQFNSENKKIKEAEEYIAKVSSVSSLHSVYSLT